MKRFAIGMALALAVTMAQDNGSMNTRETIGGYSGDWPQASEGQGHGIALAAAEPLPILASPAGLTSEGASQYSAPNVEYRTYEVTGSSVQEALDQAAALGPVDVDGNRWMGLTTWGINWQARSKGDGALVAVQVNWHATVTLPHWTLPEEVPQEEIALWNSRLQQLARHENGHVEILASSIAGIEDALKSANRNTAQSAFDAAFQQVSQRQARYEEATDHGLQE